MVRLEIINGKVWLERGGSSSFVCDEGDLEVRVDGRAHDVRDVRHALAEQAASDEACRRAGIEVTRDEPGPVTAAGIARLREAVGGAFDGPAWLHEMRAERELGAFGACPRCGMLRGRP